MLTDRCNLNCDFCYQKNKGNKDSTPEILHKSMDFLFDNASEDAKIFLWGGEPLMRFDLLRMMIETYPHVNFRFATNGHLLTKEMVSFFHKYRDTVGICLSTEVGEEPPELYGLESKCNYFVHVICTDVTKIYSTVSHLYYDRGLRHFQVGLAHLHDYKEKDFIIYKEQLERLFRWFKDDFWNEDGLTILNWEDIMRTHYEQEPKYLNYCGAGYTSIAITPMGDIYPCDWFYTLGIYKMGNIYDGIVNHSDLFDNINKNRKAMFPKCAKCDIVDHCGSCLCLTENYAKNKSIFIPVDTTCKSKKIEGKLIVDAANKNPKLRRDEWKTPQQKTYKRALEKFDQYRSLFFTNGRTNNSVSTFLKGISSIKFFDIACKTKLLDGVEDVQYYSADSWTYDPLVADIIPDLLDNLGINSDLSELYNCMDMAEKEYKRHSNERIPLAYALSFDFNNSKKRIKFYIRFAELPELLDYVFYKNSKKKLSDIINDTGWNPNSRALVGIIFEQDSPIILRSYLSFSKEEYDSRIFDSSGEKINILKHAAKVVDVAYDGFSASEWYLSMPDTNKFVSLIDNDSATKHISEMERKRFTADAIGVSENDLAFYWSPFLLTLPRNKPSMNFRKQVFCPPPILSAGFNL